MDRRRRRPNLCRWVWRHLSGRTVGSGVQAQVRSVWVLLSWPSGLSFKRTSVEPAGRRAAIPNQEPPPWGPGPQQEDVRKGSKMASTGFSVHWHLENERHYSDCVVSPTTKSKGPTEQGSDSEVRQGQGHQGLPCNSVHDPGSVLSFHGLCRGDTQGEGRGRTTT